MKNRRTIASIALVAALLALTVSALTPVAWGASPSASPSPSASAASGTPEIVGVIPDPNAVDRSGQGKMWSGDTVQVNIVPNGAELDLPKCEVWVNGQPQKIKNTTLQYLSPATPTVNFNLATSYPAGNYEFKVVLVTTKDVKVERTWKYDSVGTAGAGKLISLKVMRSWFWYIAQGSIATVELTVVSILIACVFALFGALGRLSVKMSFKQAWERYQSWGYMLRMVFGRIPYWIATLYTSLFRGTPLLLQIYVIYFATPEIVKAIGLSKEFNPPAFWAGVAALSLNYGAYLTEVFRAGIQAVPKGQTEAAWALGLSGWQTQRRVVLPQAFKIVIPAVGNDFIALIKDTSLVSTITVMELLRKASLAGAATFNFFSTLLVAAAFYWALTIFFSFWQARLERRMARDKARKVQ